jgi:hypothetical protein
MPNLIRRVSMKRLALGVAIALVVYLGLAATFPKGFLGSYTVIDLDKTVMAVNAAPQKDMPLTEYREQIKKRYEGKTLTITSQKAYTFLAPSDLDGATKGDLLQGMGGWKINPEDKDTILIYKWLSGPVYTLWGTGRLNNGVLSVKLHNSDPPGLELYLKR